MSMPVRLVGTLLASSALIAPVHAYAQISAPTTGQQVAEPAAEQPVDDGPAPEVEVSIPGGPIIVTGARDRNLSRTSDQVVAVLGAEDIARTGEGDIAGALSRVTGLSVVGSGFVYVRGLGDRYSLALLNGSPLPSPEPLKRVVPLDIFPTGVIASSLVQKSYSVNFPGEFGGGVINLTTRAVPKDPFLTVGVGLSGDSETTSQFGYSYYGSKSDFTGFDNGQRDIPPALADFLASGDRISSGTVDTQAIASQLVTGRNAVVQRLGNLPANFSANITGGTSFPVGAGDFGVIAAAGYSNKFKNREIIKQTSLSADLSTLESDFRQVNTDQRIVVNGLLGFGYEFGENRMRLTNLFIRDTIKQARLGLGNRQQTTVDFLQQDTGWFERQLFNTQFVGEFRPADALKVELRASYANSQREAPGELFFEYRRTNVASDPFGDIFVNRLNNGNGGDASTVYSDLNEDLYSAGLDVTYLVAPLLSVTLGGAWSDTRRTSSRREFQFLAPNNLPPGVDTFRPDLLLAPGIINFFGISLVESDEGNPAFAASLENHAGYGKFNWLVSETLTLDAGVRYEQARQTVDPIQVFNTPGAATVGTDLDRDYWLPAATLTWQFQPDMQFRISGSKTIARPQFRELIAQPFFDPDSNRQYRGNPFLTDSQLYNGEARLEWYFDRDQRVSLSGFFKKIENPIESFLSGIELITSYANAPEAEIYGGEFELQKYIDLAPLGGGYFADRRAVMIANYTYTQSELKVAAADRTLVPGDSLGLATDYFIDGAPLTGQSDHIVNLQFGLENTERLSQQTLLLNYASKRVVSRGRNGSPPQPDVIEKPGFDLDFVMREGMDFLGREVELKFEARNILGTDHQEYQQSGTTRIEFNSYDLGRSFSLSASVKF